MARFPRKSGWTGRPACSMSRSTMEPHTHCPPNICAWKARVPRSRVITRGRSRRWPGGVMSASSGSSRSGITRFGWCSTTCMIPASSPGIIWPNSAASRIAAGPPIWMRSPPAGCRAIGPRQGSARCCGPRPPSCTVHSSRERRRSSVGLERRSASDASGCQR